ncbi:MAG: class I SAM-dependent RNA methyltransferase [Myxococcota bacterium]
MTDASESAAQELFVGCASGLEPLLAEELRALELAEATFEIVPGGARVSAPHGLGTMARLNLELGVADQVRLRLGRFRSTKFPELVKKTSRLRWADVLSPERPLRIKAFASKSRLYHTGGIAERVHAGIAEALGKAPPLAEAAGEDVVDVHVRIIRDEALLEVDTSGEALHRRGYRLATAKAPLREDLARALVMVSGWDRASMFVDPFAGSGTVLVEAALLARRIAPGRHRGFAFERFPGAEGVLEKAKVAAKARELADVELAIFGSDRDAGAHEAAEANAERAGVRADLQLGVASLSAAPGLKGPFPEHGALVTNPPWGVRIAKKPLQALYQRLGSRVRDLPPAWKFALVTANHRLARRVGVPLHVRLRTHAGGKQVVFMSAGTDVSRSERRG